MKERLVAYLATRRGGAKRRNVSLTESAPSKQSRRVARTPTKSRDEERADEDGPKHLEPRAHRLGRGRASTANQPLGMTRVDIAISSSAATKERPRPPGRRLRERCLCLMIGA